jgi:hypothetical protein
MRSLARSCRLLLLSSCAVSALTGCTAGAPGEATQSTAAALTNSYTGELVLAGGAAGACAGVVGSALKVQLCDGAANNQFTFTPDESPRS